MNTFIKIYWKIGVSLLFGLILFLFWSVIYPAHLSYHEQFQLFLFDTDYFTERIVVPGGLADYISEFLTQFYYYTWVGALILSFIYVAIHRLFWRLCAEQGTTDLFYPFSFVPVIILWNFMCDENAMLSFTIAILFALVTANVYTYIQSKKVRIIYIIISIPLLYWSAGATHFIFAGWVIMRELLFCIKRKYIFEAFGILLGIIVLAILSPLLSSTLVQYPINRLFVGLGYYRFPEITPLSMIILSLVLILLPFVISIFPEIKRRTILYGSIFGVAISLLGCYYIALGCDMDKEEAMKYDQMVRNKEWIEIIKMAEKSSPTSPFSVTCMNLALGKTGQMSERMFEFYQNGTEGLLPEFNRDFTSPLPTGEAYYHLGMINTSQRFIFEAMEAIPNFNKSGRCFKRLAETNIINGQYEVAAKYLRMLKKTLFYKEWADEAMTYLYNEEKINSHSEWGWLRQIRLTDDFLFSDKEVDSMLGVLFQHNHRNKMAFEYMLAYVLQQRDIERFMKYYPLGKYADYDHIPRSYQEVLVYVWTQNNRNFQGMPWSISKQVMQDVTDFARIYISQPNAKALLKERFGKTYWNYLLLND